MYEAVLSIDWLWLDLKDKRMYLQFIHNSQHPINLTIGGLEPLNLETCISVCGYCFGLAFCHYQMRKSFTSFILLLNRFTKRSTHLRWFFILILSKSRRRANKGKGTINHILLVRTPWTYISEYFAF